jgi:hypothetical protein
VNVAKGDTYQVEVVEIDTPHRSLKEKTSMKASLKVLKSAEFRQRQHETTFLLARACKADILSK